MGSAGIESEMRRASARSLPPGPGLENLALRRAAARLLGRTRVGEILVSAAEREYRRFVAEALPALQLDGRGRAQLEAALVRPLLRVLELAHEHLCRGRGPERLAELLGEDQPGQRFPELAAPEDWAQMAQALAELVEAGRWPHLHWCAAEPLRLYASARAGQAAVAQGLAEGLERWLADLPLDELLQQLPADELCDELDALATTAFSRRALRLRLGERLRSRVTASARSSFRRRLAAAGYLT